MSDRKEWLVLIRFRNVLQCHEYTICQDGQHHKCTEKRMGEDADRTATKTIEGR